MRKTESKNQEEKTMAESETFITETQNVQEEEPVKKPAVKELKPLKGFRRELTKELFEELGALQCPVKEILGYVGTDEVALGKWIRRTYGYKHTLEEILRMVKQDGLIAIRRASFDQLKKSATIISQQYNRFLPDAGAEDPEAGMAAIHAFTELFQKTGEEEMEELFDE